jgi:hypothetical protein
MLLSDCAGLAKSTAKMMKINSFQKDKTIGLQIEKNLGNIWTYKT